MVTNKTIMEGLLKGMLASGNFMLSRWMRVDERRDAATMLKLCSILLSSRGEATGMALAEEILDVWSELDNPERLKVMRALLADFGPDIPLLNNAIAAYQADPTIENLNRVHSTSEPKRQELVRRLNLARSGIVALVDMRRQLQDFIKDHKDLLAVDADFLHLFSSWFNRGFLILRKIDWSTPANVLEKIIRYEAVHAITDWNDLRRRVEPEDRRCYAFFHPQLPDEPLIFVEVALTNAVSASISSLLSDQREIVRPDEASTAVFYSISNCQAGLKGVTFGNFLIKQVVEELRRDLPDLRTFVTLSPVPGLAAWLSRHGFPTIDSGTTNDSLLMGALQYFFTAKAADGRHIDPVARFHLGNGARLERILLDADSSERGMRQSFGIMVNYLYKLNEIETNHEAFLHHGEVAASPELRRFREVSCSRSDMFATPAHENWTRQVTGTTNAQSSV